MDDDVREELRLLRARAYGPQADIADDPVAVSRLRDLDPRVPDNRYVRSRPGSLVHLDTKKLGRFSRAG